MVVQHCKCLVERGCLFYNIYLVFVQHSGCKPPGRFFMAWWGFGQQGSARASRSPVYCVACESNYMPQPTSHSASRTDRLYDCIVQLYHDCKVSRLYRVPKSSFEHNNSILRYKTRAGTGDRGLCDKLYALVDICILVVVGNEVMWTNKQATEQQGKEQKCHHDTNVTVGGIRSYGVKQSFVWLCAKHFYGHNQPCIEYERRCDVATVM